MIGKVAEQQNVHLPFSSRFNTKQRVVLLFFLATDLLRLNCDYKLTVKELDYVLNYLNHYFILNNETGVT